MTSQLNHLFHAQWSYKITAILGYIILLLGISCSHSALANSLTASVDRTTISVDETVNLTVQYQGDRVNSDPDFSSLTQQFDILQNQKSMQHSVINNQISSSTEWHLTLAPKNPGQILIPPFSLEGYLSQAITLNVTNAANNTAGSREDVFIETSVSQTEGYVQEQFIITFALYYNRRVDNLDMPDMVIDNTRIETLPRVDYQKTLGQTAYGVSEFKYAVFPDASGTITLDRQTWTVRTTDQANMSRFGLGGGRYKLHRAKTDPITLTVLAKPDTYPTNHYWLPAKNVQIEQQWSRDLSEFKVGEPITRTVTVTAIGASGEQLPVIFPAYQGEDFKFYPDKPKQDSNLSAQGVVGTRTESIAIVPSHGGELTLPEVSVTWWNSAKKQVEKARLPAVTFSVPETEESKSLGAQNAAQTQPVVSLNDNIPPQPAGVLSWLWPLLSLVLLATNIVLLWLWLNVRQRLANSASPPKSDPTASLQSIAKACQDRSARDLNAAILDWVARRYPNRPPSLKALVTMANRPNLTQQIANLECRLYKDDQVSVDFDQILHEIKQFSQSTNNQTKQPKLMALYPS